MGNWGKISNFVIRLRENKIKNIYGELIDNLVTYSNVEYGIKVFISLKL
jgi:hypothetical protein